MIPTRLYILILLGFCFAACQKQQPKAVFSKLNKRQTGIEFRNLLKETEDFNIFKYQYFNNGGGLAVGDFNNDGLQDLVFTGNMVKNRLYINQGNLSFKDLTKQSGIADHEGWCTGATTVDINGDGWLDLYVCRAAFPFKKLRHNLLFINNGDLTFTEKAADYGIDDSAFSTHSAFFDYDRDGDLDLFVLNHSTVEYSRGSLEVFQLRKKEHPDFSNKLFRNDNGTFTNVTEVANISSNVLTFSLGISISDINNDGWADIFIGNDFNEPDYLFINQQDGTFKDEFASTFDHTAMFSMGSDIADINNDGLVDIVNLDMLPEGNYLQKMHSGMDNYDKIDRLQKNGFQRQYSRNMLQLNNGNGTFSEIGQLMGMSNTDWSWAPLFFDFDNDGNKDLFIANGYPKDHTDMDFLNFTANEVVKMDQGKESVDFDGYMAQMPAILVPNYFFQNQGDLQFQNQTSTWGLDEPIVSQSAAYSDLDNDGDLDLIVNNTGAYAAIYENNSNALFQHNYLKIKLKGAKGNLSGIGAKLKIYTQDRVFYQEQMPVRGFQSTVDPILNFGLGTVTDIDSLLVVWPTDERQVLTQVKLNQMLELDIKKARKTTIKYSDKLSLFAEKQALDLKHEENQYNDFKIQFLLPWFSSRQGPALAVGDVNGDGLEDVYLGNAKHKFGKIVQQNRDGAFTEIPNPVLEKDKGSEDNRATFFDADADGDLDLYVASGSYEFPENDPQLQDRLYMNNGKGGFSKKLDLPSFTSNSTCVKAADIDGDGDQDLFVGGGYIHGKYPQVYPSQLLFNNGKGNFKKIPLKRNATPINDALWLDLNGDQQMELITVGEWSAVSVFGFQNGELVEQTASYFKESTYGFWNTLHAADFDKDGDLDLVVGNLGTNSQLAAQTDEPIELFVDDFDNNGSLDPIMCSYLDGKSWPFVSRDDLIGQLPYLKNKFLYFKDYANAQIGDILTSEQIQQADKLSVNTLKSTYFENQNGQFTTKNLPIEAQIAPVHAIASLDINQDGHLDLLLAGNTIHTRVKLGRLDGNHGQVFLGDGKGGFDFLTYDKTGLQVRGASRSVEKIEINGKTNLLFGLNNSNCKLFELN